MLAIAAYVKIAGATGGFIGHIASFLGSVKGRGDYQ